ncbi:MAG TPA: hypothetical protein DCX06_05985 [Opitutae bacterium]|nr:hypothetical protein [Opitutae bacterium]
MKLKIILSIPLLSLQMYGQWVVTDPGHTAQTIIMKLQDVAQHAETIAEWTRNYEKMTEQLEVQTTIKDWMGDPILVELPSIEVLSFEDFLDALDYGIPWDTIISEADGSDSLEETHNGLFETVEATTVTGEVVTVDDAALKKYAVVDQQYTNYVTSSKEIDLRLAELQENQALTLAELEAAETDAEVQKLSAIVNAQNGQVALLISEREKQHQQYTALKSLNENQTEKSQAVSIKAQLKDQNNAYRSLRGYLDGITQNNESTN